MNKLLQFGWLMLLLGAASPGRADDPAAADGAAHIAAVGAAQTAAAPLPAATQSVGAAPAVAAASDEDEDFDEHEPRRRSDWHDKLREHTHHGWHADEDGNIVSIGHDSTLAAGRRANSVVSIVGSSTSDGEAANVVSLFGDTRVTGPVSDSAVSIVGNTFIDSKIQGDAVAVLGNIELGPHAEIDGDVVAVFGTLRQDPAAVIHGGVESIFAHRMGDMRGLRAWIDHCLLLGRPLALVPGIGWAWTLALGFLALYAGLALLFRSGISRCVQTVEAQPGHTVLAAIITLLLAPVLVVLLCVTVVGIAAVPFLVTALVCACLFGKAVMLAWLGHRITGHRPDPLGHPAFAVLIGGALVLALYLVPVLGFVLYKLLGIIGLGVVVYTLIAAVRTHQTAKAEHISPPPGGHAAERVAAGFGAAGGTPAEGTAPASGSGAGDPSAPPPAATPASPLPSATLPRAGFWIRMAALFLDVVLIGIVSKILHLGHQHLLILAVYGAVMWKLRGSTVGGIIFDLHVVRLDGRAVDWETVCIRALGCFLSLAAAGLGFIWIAIDDAHQAWHDKFAGTVVVRAPKGARVR